MDRLALKAHLKRYEKYVLKVQRYAAAPSSQKVRELLEEHEALIIDAGIDGLGRHVAHEAASSKPPRPGGGYSAAGVLAASAEIVYLLGKAHLGHYAYVLAGDLSRMAEGGSSLLALDIQGGKQFGDMFDDARRRVVLLGAYLAGREGGLWFDKVIAAASERTLKALALDVSREDRRKAKLIGRLVRHKKALDPEQQASENEILRYSLDDLVHVLDDLPGRR